MLGNHETLQLQEFNALFVQLTDESQLQIIADLAKLVDEPSLKVVTMDKHYKTSQKMEMNFSLVLGKSQLWYLLVAPKHYDAFFDSFVIDIKHRLKQFQIFLDVPPDSYPELVASFYKYFLTQKRDEQYDWILKLKAINNPRVLIDDEQIFEVDLTFTSAEAVKKMLHDKTLAQLVTFKYDILDELQYKYKLKNKIKKESGHDNG